VPAADGTTDFSVLQNELKGRSSSIVLVAFDLLYLNGRDIRKEPLVRRKAELKKIVAAPTFSSAKASRSGDARCSCGTCKLGLEGVVSKVRDSLAETTPAIGGGDH
jgi:bifunctional non-homologous end joining protein LigD